MLWYTYEDTMTSSLAFNIPSYPHRTDHGEILFLLNHKFLAQVPYFD